MRASQDSLKILNLLKVTLQEIQKEGSNKEVLINSLIDGFVFISREIEHATLSLPELKVAQELEDNLVLIVEYFNANKITEAKNIIDKRLYSSFKQWETMIYSNLKYKIIICGINNYSPKFHQLLINTQIEVIGYLNFPKVTPEYDHINYIPVISFENILELDFDYVVIVSEHYKPIQDVLERLIAPEKIINYMKMAMEFTSKYNNHYINNYEYSFVYSNLQKAEKQNNLDVIISGMSYPLQGIVTDQLSRKAVKLCWASQDLYYNYKLIDRVLKKNKSFKHCIIGMAYYTFDIDLSLLKSQSYLIDKIYYPILDDSHNYIPSETYHHQPGIESFNNNNYNLEITYPFNSVELMKDFTKGIGILQDDELIESIWNKGEDLPVEWLGKRRAYQHSRHNYLETRKENIEIFEKLLFLLNENNIETSVVIFPTSQLYRNHQRRELKKNFYEIINSIGASYSFNVYDFFDSDQFEQHDFADADHLNKKGAYKMTTIINNQVLKTNK